MDIEIYTNPDVSDSIESSDSVPAQIIAMKPVNFTETLRSGLAESFHKMLEAHTTQWGTEEEVGKTAQTHIDTLRPFARSNMKSERTGSAAPYTKSLKELFEAKSRVTEDQGDQTAAELSCALEHLLKSELMTEEGWNSVNYAMSYVEDLYASLVDTAAKFKKAKSQYRTLGLSMETPEGDYMEEDFE